MKKNIAIFEIFILVCLSFSFSYFMSKTYFTNGNNNLENNYSMQEGSTSAKIMRKIILGWLDNNIVSAQAQGGAFWTCLEDNQGSFCQEYSPSVCNEKCKTVCMPARRQETDLCKLGTCVDNSEGQCVGQSPKILCENSGKVWKDGPASEFGECGQGCCILGTQTQYTTEKRCSILGQRTGLPASFNDVGNEVACLVMANPNQEGACVLEAEEGTTCKFTTRIGCANVLNGDFRQGRLCSAEVPSCERQFKTSCVEGKDEVYWFDSCGNRENIYSSDRESSFNGGKILLKEQSCGASDLSGNAASASCGNCNYLRGSACGPERGGAQASIGDFICKDLSCNENGKVRKHGESWCAFDSRIGNAGESGSNEERSTDVPGSGHYKKICYEGEIRIESCQEFRNEICVESQNQIGNNEVFSNAACRVNRWQNCLEVNINARTENGIDAEKLNKCNDYADCYIKRVDIDSKFKFDTCVPKYPPGFDLRAENGGDVGGSLCGLASQKCTYVKVKGLFGSKKVNSNCKTEKFTETMNNLCISLGDCGAKVNVIEEYTDDGYRVDNAPELGSDYIGGLKSYSKPLDGQTANTLSEKELAELFKIIETDPKVRQDKLGSMLGQIGAGATGALLAYYFAIGGTTAALTSGSALFGVSAVSSAAGSGAAAAAASAAGIGETAVLSGASEAVAALGPWGTAAAAGAAGAAVGYFVGKMFGLEGEGLTHVVIAGAVAGAVSGYVAATAFEAGQITNALTAFGYVVFWVIAVVIAVAVVMSILGIGKAKKTIVEFQCLPWQPPSGGSQCRECGRDGRNGLPCSKYKCQSLGQTCEFINEGTSDEACIDIAPNDVASPVIKPNFHALLSGFSYKDVSDDGFKVEGSATDGCVPSYSSVRFGVTLNEPGQCKFDSERKSFDDMGNYFDILGGNIYKINHTSSFVMPSLDVISASLPDEGISRDVRKDFSLFVRCKDKKGNVNNREYTINFCVSPENDLTAPIINIAESSYAKFEATSKTINFFTNEPAECKWSKIDGDYDSMANEAECANELEDSGLFGWPCSANLPLNEDESKFYFRCSDQPWIISEPTPEGRVRNKNSQSVIHTVKRTTTPLTIDSVSPNNEIIKKAGLPVYISLSVKTGGGASEARRWCEFSFGGSLFTRFFESSTNIHKQSLSLATEQSYSIPIRCEDDAGNTAEAVAGFSIDVDNEGPMVTRVYRQGSEIKIITNEPAVCAYSFLGCGFIFDDGDFMQGNNLAHTAQFGPNVYSIKCKDTYSNTGSCLSVGRSLV